jgi:hypothetical protein
MVNEQETLIRKTLEFIFKANISQRNLKPSKIERKVSIPREYIIEAFRLLQPYYVADEVLFFYLSINDLLTEYSGCFLGRDRINGNIFRLFPFELVYPLSPGLNPRMSCWIDLDEPFCLFQGDGYFLNTPILESPQSQAPITYFLKFGGDEILCYSSLTNLLLMVAECYDTDAYYYDRSKSWEAQWREELSKSEAIFYKYNPGLTFRSPNEPGHFDS